MATGTMVMYLPRGIAGRLLERGKKLSGFAWEGASLSGGLPRAGLSESMENVGQEVMTYGLEGLPFLEIGKVTLSSPARMHIE